MTQAAQALDRAFLDSFADGWHEAWNSHDPARVAALCTPDVVLEQSSSPTLRGHAGAVQSVGRLHTASADHRFEATEAPYLSADGSRAIVPWRMTGTMTGPLVPPGLAPTGQRVVLSGDDHWQFRDGLMARCRVLFDVNDLSVQLGATPPPGSTGERLGVLLQHLTARRMRARARRSGAAGGTAR